MENPSKVRRLREMDGEFTEEKFVECALFGNYTHELHAFLGFDNKDGTVVVLLFVRVKLYNECCLCCLNYYKSYYGYSKLVVWLICSSCGSLFLSITLRYRIEFGFLDCTCFVVFDNEAKQVLEKICVEILDPLLLDVDYTGGLLPISKVSLIIEGEEKGAMIKSKVRRIICYLNSNESVDNGEFEMLKNVITPTKRLFSKEGELAYDTNELTHTNLYTEQKMTYGQRSIFDEILNIVITDSGNFYFVYGHGRCGKSFIWNGLSSTIRSRRKIVLNVASSGIASLLLPGGKTAHSRFSIPITITDKSTCNIKHGSLKTELLIKTQKDLISVTSQHKTHQPFGGKVVILGGDFKQILPVILKESRHDIFSLAINSSHPWSFHKVLKLHTNMRLLMSSSD
ncbi:hypothetical protein Ahy_A09g044633 [Arachis hypogaea]|uniref:ATP-dependent DNA helicase n=1 Tax=Arachis hypogaea TaxID=3818 RepID=A0A445BKF6_ARAHY|nr:hypothetical protein Ahy_A09g044633 [Arachis hypogaea]